MAAKTQSRFEKAAARGYSAPMAGDHSIPDFGSSGCHRQLWPKLRHCLEHDQCSLTPHNKAEISVIRRLTEHH